MFVEGLLPAGLVLEPSIKVLRLIKDQTESSKCNKNGQRVRHLCEPMKFRELIANSILIGCCRC